MDLETYFSEKRKRVDAALDSFLPKEESHPTTIHKAMRYSVFAGGKRIRPILILTTNMIFGGEEEAALPAACAIELIHTYSLIHDDLPCMDDDDFRRGKPTSHKVFGEAMAVLAGDALFTHAFEILSRYPEDETYARKKVKIIELLSRAAGTSGMVGGQVIDIEPKEKGAGREVLDRMHTMKTAALFSAAAAAGGIISPASVRDVEILAEYGRLAGLAFQVVDDILDVVGDEKKLGKTKGKDSRDGKLTYVSEFGLDSSRKRAGEILQEIMKVLEPLGDKAAVLGEIARFIVRRAY